MTQAEATDWQKRLLGNIHVVDKLGEFSETCFLLESGEITRDTGKLDGVKYIALQARDFGYLNADSTRAVIRAFTYSSATGKTDELFNEAKEICYTKRPRVYFGDRTPQEAGYVLKIAGALLAVPSLAFAVYNKMLAEDSKIYVEERGSDSAGKFIAFYRGDTNDIFVDTSMQSYFLDGKFASNHGSVFEETYHLADIGLTKAQASGKISIDYIDSAKEFIWRELKDSGEWMQGKDNSRQYLLEEVIPKIKKLCDGTPRFQALKQRLGEPLCYRILATTAVGQYFGAIAQGTVSINQDSKIEFKKHIYSNDAQTKRVESFAKLSSVIEEMTLLCGGRRDEVLDVFRTIEKHVTDRMIIYSRTSNPVTPLDKHINVRAALDRHYHTHTSQSEREQAKKYSHSIRAELHAEQNKKATPPSDINLPKDTHIANGPARNINPAKAFSKN